MSVEPLSSLHTCFPGGHAHPSPVTATMPPGKIVDQHLEDLLSGVAFEIEMRGLASNSHTPHKMHCPRLRKSEAEQQAISHLDTISCWKGISNAQALELTLWERLFHQCLMAKIEEHLRRCIINRLKEREELVDEAVLLLSLIQTLSDGNEYLLDIEVASLLHSMVDTFYEDHPSQTAARNFQWSLTSGDLPSFVYNFLSTQDCFQNTHNTPRLFVECSLDWYIFPVLTVIAKVAWQPPTIQFLGIPAQLRSRGQYVIAPCPVRTTEASNAAGFTQYSSNTEYTVKSSSSRIQWDDASELFRAQAPDKAEGVAPTVSETIVQVNLTTQFSGDVRFERVSRYAIKVEVVDACQLDTTVGKHETQSESTLAARMQPRRSTRLFKPRLRKHRQCIRLLDCPLQALHQSIEQRRSIDNCSDQKMSSDVATADTETEHFAQSEPILDSHSPRKRKISSCENVIKTDEHGSNSPGKYSSEAELKRRKMKEPYVANLHLELIPQNPLGSIPRSPEDHNSDTILKALETLLECVKTRSPDNKKHEDMVRRLSDPIYAALVLVLDSVRSELSDTKNEPEKEPCEKPGRKTTLQCPTPPRRASDFNYSDRGSPNSASDASDIDVPGPPNSTFTSGSKHSSELSQEIIQHNYREFVEVARRKTLQQPDVGDMSFEKIFLGDSEAESWHSSDVGDASGLSGDMSGLDIDKY